MCLYVYHADKGSCFYFSSASVNMCVWQFYECGMFGFGAIFTIYVFVVLFIHNDSRLPCSKLFRTVACRPIFIRPKLKVTRMVYAYANYHNVMSSFVGLQPLLNPVLVVVLWCVLLIHCGGKTCLYCYKSQLQGIITFRKQSNTVVYMLLIFFS